jgi:hypothetical protein
MASSEHVDTREQLTEPVEPHAGREVNPHAEPGQAPNVQPKDAEALPTAEPVQTVEPPEPAEPAEPGIYVYEGEETFGNHPFLGELQHGENDFTAETHPDKLQAIGDLVAAGVLRKA